MVAAMNGSTMMASTNPAVRMPMPYGGPMKSLPMPGERPGVLDQPRLDVPLQHGRQHEQAPDTEDDARHRREQLDGDADRPLQQRRTELGQEQRDPESRREPQAPWRSTEVTTVP